LCRALGAFGAKGDDAGEAFAAGRGDEKLGERSARAFRSASVASTSQLEGSSR